MSSAMIMLYVSKTRKWGHLSLDPHFHPFVFLKHTSKPSKAAQQSPANKMADREPWRKEALCLREANQASDDGESKLGAVDTVGHLYRCQGFFLLAGKSRYAAGEGRQRPRLVYWSIKTVAPVSSAWPLHSAPRAQPRRSHQRSSEVGGAEDPERVREREREREGQREGGEREGGREWGESVGEGRGEPSVFEWHRSAEHSHHNGAAPAGRTLPRPWIDGLPPWRARGGWCYNALGPLVMSWELISLERCRHKVKACSSSSHMAQ